MRPCGFFDRTTYDSCRRDGRAHDACIANLARQCHTDLPWDWPDPPSANDSESYVLGMWGGGGRGSHVRDPDAPHAPPCTVRAAAAAAAAAKQLPLAPLRIPTTTTDEARDALDIAGLAGLVLAAVFLFFLLR